MTLEDEIIELISSKLDVEKNKLNRNSHLINDLKADSLDLIEIRMDIEEKYKLTIPDEDAKKFNTIGDILDYMSKNYKEPPPSLYN